MVDPVSVRLFNKCGQKRPANHKKTSIGKISKPSSTIVAKTNKLEAKKRHFGVRKEFTARKSYLALCLKMGKFVSDRASTYNKILDTQSITKQEHP